MSWICKICSTANPDDSDVCYVCDTRLTEEEKRENREASEAAARLERERLEAEEREAARREAERLEREREEERMLAEARRAEEREAARREAERLRREREAEAIRAREARLARIRALEEPVADRFMRIGRIVFISSLGLFGAATLVALSILAFTSGLGTLPKNFISCLKVMWKNFSALFTVGFKELFISLFTGEPHLGRYLAAFFTRIWGNVKDVFIVAIPAFFGSLVKDSSSCFSRNFLAFFSAWGDNISNMWRVFIASFVNLGGSIASMWRVLMGAFRSIGHSFAGSWQVFRTVFVSAWENITALFK